MNTPLLSVDHLVKRYGDATVVNDLSFHIEPGECLGVIGPNGAGKTTTLRMCLGLSQPDGGDIVYFGGQQMPRDALAIKSQLGVVAQMDTLDPDFTSEENLLVFGRYFGLPDATIRERIPKLLEFAALTHKAKAKPGELSGGMKRRLSLARALINHPQLLMLDEPTTGLDPQARHLMWERLQVLLQEGKSILLTTHFMDEAERLCSRLLVLDQGRKIAEGKPRDLIAEHLEPEVVEVFGQGAVALFGQGAVALAQEAHLKALAGRIEVSGETVFFYTQDSRSLLAALQAWPALRTLHRPSIEIDRTPNPRRRLSHESDPKQHLGRASTVHALVACISAQLVGLEKAGHPQPGGQHRRTADVAGGLWLWPGFTGRAN
ncbi:MAG: Daunorubicin/doxorubicin resistance ATP-binding protein DrrA [Pseudomonadota bacterium]